jgi:hypothetical protein
LKERKKERKNKMVVTRNGNRNQNPPGMPPVVPLAIPPALPPDLPVDEPLVLPPPLPPGVIPIAPPGPPIWLPPMQPPVLANAPLLPGPVTFPTHPVGLDPNATYFTYESAKERKYFEKATEAMDTKYDGSAKGLLMFITKVELKSEMFGWETILRIPTAVGHLSLLDQYGQITIADIHNHAVSYMHAQCRERQDAHHLKLFLAASLTDTFMMRVLAHKSQYLVAGTQHGPSMFSVILSLVGLHSKATVAVINAALRRLPTKMEEVGSNIERFNEYVVSQCNELTSRGKTAQDLVSLLFEAYNTASNEEFKFYMRQKWQSILDGTIPELSAYEVMYVAEEYYKHRLTTGEWKENLKTETKGLIENAVLLRAEFEAYKAEVTEKYKKRVAGRNNDKKFAWKELEPKAHEPHYKTVGSKDYVFCPNHESTKWVLAEKHKDGCTKDPGWTFPNQGAHKYKARISTLDGGNVPALTPVPIKSKYVNALMSIVDNSMQTGEYGEYDDENI